MDPQQAASTITPSSLQALRELRNDRREGRLASARQNCLNIEERESTPMITPSSLDVLRKERHQRAIEKQSNTQHGRLDLTKVHILHLQAILWLPTAAFLILIDCIYNAKPSLFDTCDPTDAWAYMLGEPRDPSPLDPSTCAFIDMLERPIPLVHSLLFATTMYALLKHRILAEKQKRFTLGLMFVTTTAIRCLSSFSGWTARRNFPFLLFMSNSPGKAVWLWVLMSLWFWDWTYLGVYKDVYYDEVSRSIRDETGQAVWTHAANHDEGESSNKRESEEVPLYASFYIPWQDVVVRLSYIHVIDNLIHVLWLRFYIENRPYTAYLNNSEILTALLLIQVLVYTYARMRSHVHFCRGQEDEETLVGSNVSKKRITAHKSWTKGLIARPARQNLPQEILASHLLMILLLVLVSILILFAPKLPEIIPLFP